MSHFFLPGLTKPRRQMPRNTQAEQRSAAHQRTSQRVSRVERLPLHRIRDDVRGRHARREDDES